MYFVSAMNTAHSMRFQAQLFVACTVLQRTSGAGQSAVLFMLCAGLALLLVMLQSHKCTMQSGRPAASSHSHTALFVSACYDPATHARLMQPKISNWKFMLLKLKLLKPKATMHVRRLVLCASSCVPRPGTSAACLFCSKEGVPARLPSHRM